LTTAVDVSILSNCRIELNPVFLLHHSVYFFVQTKFMILTARAPTNTIYKNISKQKFDSLTEVFYHQT